jgi:hypothetical protein
LEDEESYVSNDCPTEVEENFYNEEFDCKDEKDFPLAIRDKFSGIPRNIRMLETFYNPPPYGEWADARTEAALHKRAVKLQEAAHIAIV